MKRIALLFGFLLAIMAAQGQSAKVQSGFTHMKYNELDKAKDCFDTAILNAKTSGQSKTWYYRGQCYYKLAHTNDENFKSLADNPMMVSYKSFIKAMELDKKQRYEKELLFELQRIRINIFNKGIDEYELEQYEQSLESYEAVLEIGDLSYIDIVDTAAFFNAGLAADQAGLYEKAIDYYLISTEHGYEGAKVYKYIADMHMAMGDTLSALDSYEKGIDAHPEDNVSLYIELINYYLGKEDLESAGGYIESALAKDTLNASLWYVYGLSLEGNDGDKALEVFDKALEINPEYYDALYMAGQVHFNRGIESNKIAMEIPLDQPDEYKAANEITMAHFKKALPYFEKAYELRKDDILTLTALKELYYRFKMLDKRDEIIKRIEDLQ